MKTAVFLLDDHGIVREGLRLVIDAQPHLEVCGEASSLAAALEASCRPDVVIADLVLEDARGADVLDALTEHFPGVHIVVLSMIDSPAEVQMAFAHGARGFVPKEAAATELVEAIRRVRAGEEYIEPALGAALARWAATPARPRSEEVAALTRREREVLRLLALGYTNAEVAAGLYVSLRTVESHRAHIMQKLGARTRAELVRAAVDADLLEDSASKPAG